MFVSILQQGDFLIASIHAALDDTEFVRFQEDLVEQIGARRAKASSSTSLRSTYSTPSARSSLRDLAHMARLRGAVTVIVGIQPDVAFAIVKLGMDSRHSHRAGPRRRARLPGRRDRWRPHRRIGSGNALDNYCLTTHR